MLRPALTIAYYTVLEALRNRLLWLCALMAVGAVGLAGFVGDLALTESRQTQAALLAAALRLGAVGLIGTFVVTSMAREAADKGQELLLALAMPRAAYLLGKLAGFGALAVLPATLFGALSLAFAAPAQSAAWSVSLLCELWIVAAFSLLCALSLNQAMPALAASAGFYLLARAIGGLQLIGHARARGGAGQQWLSGGVDLLAAALPHLDQFTRTEWLLYGGADPAAVLAIVLHSALYIGLLCAAALFDLYRKSF